jgi:thiamine-monophosphate kinase
MSLSEFELIQQYFSDIRYANSDAVALGVGDDCALLQLKPEEQMALSIDTLVAGVHFHEDSNPYDIATRSIAVTVSDLAAMGANPLAFTLALTLPKADSAWLEPFSRGLRESAERYGLSLIGGDTTRGPLSLTLQVHGSVPVGQALTRSGAQVGDLILVSGSLGDGRAALDCFDPEFPIAKEYREELIEHFHRPQARVELGVSLREVATAAIDVSDGLLADLGHIARASGVTAQLALESLPISPALRQNWAAEQAQQYALSGGDDYELLFTAAPDYFLKMPSSSTQITVIGQILSRTEADCVDGTGNPLNDSGYKHFC